MALFLSTICAIPTVIGTAEAVSAQKKEDAIMKHKAKFFMTVDFSIGKEPPKEAQVVLKDNKLYLNHPDAPKQGHRFCGYYFGYPGTDPEEHGLVSSIQDDPPMLNWIYVDKETLEMKYGTRGETLGNIAHPWEWTEDEQNITLEEDEGFVAIEVEPGLWQLFFDANGDFSGLPEGKKIKEVCLKRMLMCGWNSQLIGKKNEDG